MENFLQVQDNSPGQAAGLEPFFDYVVAIGEIRLVSYHIYLFGIHLIRLSSGQR